ncbi:antirestriction protein ArdA [Hungatella hathewayi]|uniref:antirestriction protein ArdA n=1 Tax=Hungatella hathewayi TaxID=154046 RepID=UPI00356811ED
MLKINLTHNENQDVWLTLPSSYAEIRKTYAVLEVIDSVQPETSVRDAVSSIYNLPEYLRGTIVTDQALKELQFLSRRIDRITTHEQDVFAAALDIEKPCSLMEIVNLSCNLDKFAFYNGVISEMELGKYPLERDHVEIPERLVPYIDYEMIGKKYANSHAGRFMEEGYAVWTGEALELVYDGKYLPDPAYEKNGLFLLQFYTGSEGCSVSLPASAETLEFLKKRLGVTDLNNCIDFHIDCSIDGLKERLPCGCCISELNAFAEILQNRILDGTEETMKLLLAALEAEIPENMNFALDIANNLERYELIKDIEAIQSPEDYAYYVIENQGLFIADEAADFIDYEAMGKALLYNHGVTQTSIGPVCRTDRPIRKLPEELITLRLFSPLYARLYEKNEWGGMEQDTFPMNGKEIFGYQKEILSMIKQEHLNHEADRGLAIYLNNVLLKRKVYSMIPTVAVWQDELWGVLEVKSYGKLSDGERKELIREWSGQCCDGWGEGVKQHPIHTKDGELYVSFWHSGSNYFIKEEEELKGERGQDYERQMGGI